MQKQAPAILLAHLILLPLLLVAQESSLSRHWASVEQSIEVQEYRGKKIRLRLAVKQAVGREGAGEAAIWVEQTGRASRSMTRMFSIPNYWAFYSVDYKIDDHTTELVIAIAIKQGHVLFDDLQLWVEKTPGQWEAISVPNAGFEDWDDTHNVPLGWNISRTTLPITKVNRGVFQGNYAMSLLMANEEEEDRGSIKPRIESNNYVYTPYLKGYVNTDEKGVSQGYQIQQVPLKAMGLDGEIDNIFRDSRGFLWFTSSFELIRYDGMEIKRYSPTDIPIFGFHNGVDILEDNRGHIWFTAFSGVFEFDPKTEKFKQWILDKERDWMSMVGSYTALALDDFGNIYVGTYSGLYRIPLKQIDREGGERELIEHYTYSDLKHDPRDSFIVRLPNNRIYDLLKDVNGNIWIGSGGGLSKLTLDPKDGTIGQIQNHNDFFDWKAYYHRFEFVSEDTSRQIIHLFFQAAPPGGVSDVGRSFVQFNTETSEFSEHYQPDMAKSNAVAHEANVHQDPSGTFWISTHNGLFFGDPTSELERLEFGGLSDRVEDVYVDPSGIIWVGTSSSGLYKISKVREEVSFFAVERHLEEFVPPPFSPSELPGFVGLWGTQPIIPVLSTEDAAGNMWVTLSQGRGVCSLPPDQPADPVVKIEWNLGFDNIYVDQNGSTWFSERLRMFRNAEEVKLDGIDFGDKWVSIEIYGHAPDNQILISTQKYFYFLDNHTYQLTPITFENVDFKATPHDQFRTLLHIDEEGKCWALSSNHLFEFKYDASGAFSYIEQYDLTAYFQFGAQVFDHGERLWLATNKGLFSFNKYSKQVTFAEGTQNIGNPFFFIAPDQSGFLWLIGSNGNFRFNTEDERIDYSFLLDLQAIQADLYKFSYHPRASTGEIFIPAEDGFYLFQPNSLQLDERAPKIAFTDIWINDEKLLAGQSKLTASTTPYIAGLDLRHNQNDLVMAFSALHFLDPAKNQYAYYLENWDTDWKYVGQERLARYSNLSPGNYTFRVKAANADGFWNEAGISLNITIHPPWYWAWWSKALYLLAFTSALYAFYLWRTRQHRQKLALQEKALAQEQLLNARLQQIDKLKDQFLANTSHELRTPLHGIIGIAESLFDSVKNRTAQELQDNLGMILASGRRLASLVNDLLDFSRAKNKDLNLQLKSIDLKSVAGLVLHACQPLAANTRIMLQNHIPEDLPPVLADDNRLQQILYNLIGNAIKFTFAGSVTISARKAENMIIVSVKDTGIGIPENKRDAIFQEFEQADGTASREFAGTGLGLSISKRLVELHGGEMWVESTHAEDPADEPEVITGSTFYFSLPVSDHMTKIVEVSKVLTPIAASDTPAKLSLPIGSDAGDRIKVLVVDDEPINHQVLKNYLPGDQYLITSVMSGREALEAIELGVKFDLVLLDVMMPHLSGYEVCKRIREKYLASELPVIMVTAKNQIKDLVEGLSVGANDYLAKPFSKDEFLARINTQLDLHRIFDVTGRFVPNEFIRTLGRERITDVLSDDHIEREVTVLFSDIRRFTTLAETMTPTESYKFINALNRRLGPIIRENRGFINQYLGDGLMAIFQQGPATALAAAIQMQQKITHYNEERKLVDRQPIQLGIGFHSGSLIMGIVGDTVRMDTATVADTVNTASRIEGLTKYYGVNILFTTDSLAKMNTESLKDTRYLGRVLVKGKKEPQGIYECFAGDAAEMIELKRATSGLFEEGLEQYHSKKFTEAASIFQQILKQNPQDYTARLFLGKAAGYISSGVPEEWTGVEKMDEK